LKTLVDKGGDILERQINKRTGGGADGEALDVPAEKKESFFESIPMPVKIGGLGLLAFAGYKIATRK